MTLFFLYYMVRYAGAFWRDGVILLGACLIHASTEVHPGEWVGYLKAAPLGLTSGGHGGQQISVPRGKGVRIPGDTNPAVFGTTPILALP
jgi:hypothetical protein